MKRANINEEVEKRDEFLERVFLAITMGCFSISLAFLVGRKEEDLWWLGSLAMVSLVGMSTVWLLPQSGSPSHGEGDVDDDAAGWVKVVDTLQGGGRLAEVMEVIHG